MVIFGSNLGDGADITNVILCGVSATNIASQSATQVVVWAGSRGSTATGDVVVFSTSRGVTTKAGGFSYTGETTRVVLYDFWLRAEGGEVRVGWQTASEEDTVGFDLYRWQDAAWVKVNEALIPAQGEMGASYGFVDSAANATDTFRYKLVEIETDGGMQEYGPFDVAAWNPRLQNVGVGETGTTLRWLSREGEIYEVRKSQSLLMPPLPIAAGLHATPPVNEFTDSAPTEGSAFYRIRAE